MSNLAKNKKTIYNIISEFEEHLTLKGYTKSSLTSNLKRIRPFLNHTQQQNLELKNITKNDIYKYHNQMKQNGRSTHTQINNLSTIRIFFAWLTDQRIILVDPACTIPNPKLEKKLPNDVLTEKQMMQLLNLPLTTTHEGIRDKAILEILYSTGMRRMELYNLKLTDIDLKQRIVRINNGKGKKDRILPLGKTAINAIQQYLKIRKPNPNIPQLFTNIHYANTRRIGEIQITKIVKKYGKQLDLDIKVHSIRRSFATHMIRAGASPMIVKEFMGHSKIETLGVYVRLAAKDVKEVHRQHHPRG